MLTEATNENRRTKWPVELGPALLAVLTWLGPGDIIEATVAGGNYGYSLLWVLALAVAMRFAMVSMISKYHLCNVHGEGVINGLRRLHAVVPFLLGVSCVVMAHAYCSYMTAGMGELGVAYIGFGNKMTWATIAVAVGLIFVVRPTYRRFLLFFRFCLALLVVTVLGAALWSGPELEPLALGLVGFSIPRDFGAFGVLLVALSMSGAISGSVSNFIYPHLLAERGWSNAGHRKLQQYDLMIGVVFLFLFNLAMWIIGATQLYPTGKSVSYLIEIPKVLESIIGPYGCKFFALGMAAAVFTSLIGFAHCLGGLADRCFAVWNDKTSQGAGTVYHVVSISAITTSLVWSTPGMPGSLQMALVVNCAQIVLVPLLAVSVWTLTARKEFIGEQYKNCWWENLLMAVLTCLAIYGAVGAVRALVA